MNILTCTQCRHENPIERSTCQRCGAPLPLADTAAPANPSPPANPSMFRRGQIIANRYVVQDLIGRGGMGCIYKVYDNTLKETVALKTLLPEFVRDKLVVDRFFNEARIARSLSHPNVVRVHDIGADGNTVYISMEYLQGKSLREVLDDMTPGQRLDIRSVLRIFDELCDALIYAHRFTIHRDIKPENVMIVAEGKVKLMDFGISKLMTRTNLTAASMVMGTPHYMSPEQLRNSAGVDARADIYSVGVMLYEVLTGNTPTGVPKPASEITHEVPPALDPIIERCLNPGPAKRFPNALALREALAEVRRAVESGSDVRQPVAPLPSADASSLPRKAVGALLVLLVAAGAAAAIWKAEERRKAIAATAPDTRQFANNLPQGDHHGHDDFSTITNIIAEARRKAEVRQRQVDSEQRKELFAKRIDEGGSLWELAEAERADNPAAASTHARHALQYYLSVLVQTPGTVFVPPGEVTVQSTSGASQTITVGAFLISERPVTAQTFGAFCQDEDWRWPGYSGDPSHPMTNVTFYDALAYAATRQSAATLPTAEQWTRAIEFATSKSALLPWDHDGLDQDGNPIEEPLYLAGQYLEWTRTTATGEPPGFRVPIVTRGGSFTGAEFKPASPASISYESRAPNLTFRTIVEIPVTIEQARALLQRQ